MAKATTGKMEIKIDFKKFIILGMLCLLISIPKCNALTASLVNGR